LDPNSGEYNLKNADKCIIINNNITIKSSSPSKNAVINLNNYGWLFFINNTGSLTLINVTIKNGNFYECGAIVNYGTLIIDGCTFEKNTAQGANGGAIFNYNSGKLNISNSVFKANSAAGGGAIYNMGSANFNIVNSIFIDNSASTGGAIHNTGTLTISGSTFTDNTASIGGVFYNTGTLIVNWCTFIDNYASSSSSDEIWGLSTSTVPNSVFYHNTVLTLSSKCSHEDADTNHKFVIKVTTKHGKIIAGQIVDIFVDGKLLESKITNSAGEIELQLNLNIIKTFTIMAQLRDFTKSGYQYKSSYNTLTITPENHHHIDDTITPPKLTPANIQLSKILTSKPVVKKGKKIYTKTYSYKNFGQTTGSKKFTISISKKFNLYGIITKTKYVSYTYNKKTKKITVTVQQIPYNQIGSIKFRIIGR